MVKRIKTNTRKGMLIKKMGIGFMSIILLNILADSFYTRLDLTKEGRFTLSNSTEKLIDKIEDDLYITVFLDGDIPVDYKRLQSATRDMLNEYRLTSSGKISFDFEDVLEDMELKDKEKILGEIYGKGLRIERAETAPDEAPSEKYIIPAGIVFYKGQEYPFNLLKREFGKPLEEEINGSIELLEYEIGNAIRKAIVGKDVKLGFTTGHGELTALETADIGKELSGYYSINQINLNLSDSNCYKIFAKDVVAQPDKPVFTIIVEGLIRELKKFNGIVIAKPTKPFTEPEKYVLDQYVMNGGRVIFLVENLLAEMDSVAKYGQVSTINHSHNLDDLLFHYGVKVQPTLVQDLQCHGIPAINQQTNRPGFFPWMFYPLYSAVDDNPVSKNLENVWGQYSSTLDTTTRKALKHTVLLRSSPKSRVAHNPVLISLDLLKITPDPANFNKGNQIAAVLVEGEFTSPFRFRDGIKKEFDIPFIGSIKSNAMIVIGDGDIIRNQTSSDGQVYPLGYDKFASKHFGAPVEFANKKFFMNCVDFLCDETNLIEVRSREVELRLLDKVKIKKERAFWQSINMIVPILLVIIFGLINSMYRKRRWA